MDVFIGVVIACACGAIGFFAGSTWALEEVKAGCFRDEGYSYSYFDNHRKRHEMGRI